MTVSEYQFRHELRQLIETHISSSSTFENYVLITGELEEAKNRLELDAEKFPDEEVDACEL
ncbi:hypothetical protein FXV83_27940 [Bradyrhizobium hipponense]|uniref:Uncharacterized protein n=1 Tax=Bradyrhizobium hipponense TaxID=2605638 RepID=A0A5S4YG47_9BRAD|nr:hypothetical protein [Bradyrhizobium hipponense]TYO63380.1 hypothetical protein FXV83_27940 [Bradyrhizobium hipponense]